MLSFAPDAALKAASHVGFGLGQSGATRQLSEEFECVQSRQSMVDTQPAPVEEAAPVGVDTHESLCQPMVQCGSGG